MDKLLELLNKAKPLKKYKEYWYIWNEIYLYTYAEDYWASQSRNITLDVISKSYGFIKWLVENDKIYASEIMLDDRMWTIYDKTDSTLMMLSIQDNPIDFLISILK